MSPFFFVLRSLLMNIYVVFLVFHNDILSSVTKKGCPIIKKKKNKSDVKEKSPKKKWIPNKRNDFYHSLTSIFDKQFR